MKKDRVSIRLPEELQNYEAFGFTTITDYIKTALVEYNQNTILEVVKANKIMERIEELLAKMEHVKGDDPEYPKEKDSLMEALYQSAYLIAKSDLMQNSKINNKDLDHAGNKCYVHRHWVAD